MVPDLTLEVLYLDQPTDFKMEFELCSSSNVRFLSLPVKNQSEFLSALSKSVVRSRVIIAVGSFDPSDKLYIPKIIAKATGYALQEIQKETFGIVSDVPMLLPESSMPLVDENGNLGGCVLESNDQSIIMLTPDKELRHNLIVNLVCPYLKLFADKKTLSSVANISDNSACEKPAAEPPAKNQPDDLEDKNQQILLENQNNNDTVVAVQPSQEVEPKTDAKVEKVVTPSVDAETTQQEVKTEGDLPEYSVLEQPETVADSKFNISEFLIDDVVVTRKPKNLKALIKVAISIALVVSVILATYFGYDRVFQPMQRNSVYDEARKLYGQSWNQLPEDMLNKFGKLYQTNSDIYGWLSIPTTNINLPVVSLAQKTSGYYRSHLFDGSVNRYGTLYTSSTAVKGSYQRNIVIYGNDTGDQVMFSDLDKFLSVKYYKEVPAFTFDTLYLESKWKIFSSFKINPKNRGSYLKTTFFDDTEFLDYIQFLEKVSVIDTNIDVKANDQIVTLVSQSDDKDVILVARRVRDDESPMVDITGATENYTAQNSSGIPVVNPLKPIEVSSDSKETSSEVEEPVMEDSDSSRFEQQEPLASTITLKPTTIITPTSSEESTSNESTTSQSDSDSSSNSKNDSSVVDKNSSLEENTSNPNSSTAESGSDSGDSSIDENSSQSGNSSADEGSSEIGDSSSDESSSNSGDLSSIDGSSSAEQGASSSGSSDVDNSNSSNNESEKEPTIPAVPSEKLPMLTVTNAYTGEKFKANTIDIIARNLEAEMGSSFHIEALKAQAVAAYSWLLKNGSANNQYPELPLKEPSAKCIEAATAVAGQVAVYNGEIATTVYHAISAGRTAFSQDIWSNSVPYLVSVDSSVDKNAKGYQTQRKYKAEKVAVIAEALLGVNLRTITDKSKWFSCEYDANGVYCTKITIGGIEQKGPYMRNVFFNPTNSEVSKLKDANGSQLVTSEDTLRSSAYTISYNKSEDAFIFTVNGYGHGVGMSQMGAHAYAERGWTYEEILKHYYQGITLGTYY